MLIQQCSHFLCANWNSFLTDGIHQSAKSKHKALKLYLISLIKNEPDVFHAIFFLASTLVINYSVTAVEKEGVANFTEDVFCY